MTDYFALLGEPRRPWLDAEQLKAKFLAFSAETHPDKVRASSLDEKEAANRRYAELNAAYNCLREPKDRLLHLLELESGQKPQDIQRIPPGTMDLFIEVGQICRDVDAFLAERAKALSPLVRVQLFEKGMEWTEKLNAIQQKVNAQQSEIISELKEISAQFDTIAGSTVSTRHSMLPLERVEQLYRIFCYVSRWTGQIQERIVQLAL